jgi:hypothetical protein
LFASTPSATAEIISAITPAVSETDQLASLFDPAEQAVICRFLAEVIPGFRSWWADGEPEFAG